LHRNHERDVDLATDFKISIDDEEYTAISKIPYRGSEGALAYGDGGQAKPKPLLAVSILGVGIGQNILFTTIGPDCREYTLISIKL